MFRVEELRLAGGNLTLDTTRGGVRTRTEIPLVGLQVEARGGELELRSGGGGWRLPLADWDPASVHTLCVLLRERAAAAADAGIEQPPPGAQALMARVQQGREPS